MMLLLVRHEQLEWSQTILHLACHKAPWYFTIKQTLWDAHAGCKAGRLLWSGAIHRRTPDGGNERTAWHPYIAIRSISQIDSETHPF